MNDTPPTAPQEHAPQTESQSSASPPANWVEGIENQDLRGWAMNKGFHQKEPTDVLESYRQLEKILGADRAGRTVEVPGNWDDADSVQQFYEKLGAPKTAEEYDLPIPDEGTLGRVRDMFHAAKIPERQAKVLAEKWEEHQKKYMEDLKAQEEARTLSEVNDLKKEWGEAFQANSTIADDAARRFNLSDEDVKAFREVLGPKRAMNLLHDIGSRLGEHTFITGDSAPSGVMTPAQAKAKINDLAADKDFMSALGDGSHPGHKTAQERYENILDYLHPPRN